MAVEDIFKALDKQADEDCAAQLSHSRAQSEKIIEDAKEHAEQLRAERLVQVEREVNLARNKRINTARLDGKKRGSSQREQLIQEVFGIVEDRMKQVRERPDYPDVLERLLAEALRGFEDPEVVIHVDPRDADLVAAVVQRLRPSATVVTDLKSAGGVKVTSADDKVQRVNTLESRLAKARRVVKWNVAAALFGN